MFYEAAILRMCRVKRSSFNARKLSRETFSLAQLEKELMEDRIKRLIPSIVRTLGYVPGARVIRNYLWRDHDIHVGRKLVTAVMKKMNLFPAVPKKDAYKGHAKYDHPYTAPDNLVLQDFFRAPRKVICTDITYLYFGIARIAIYLCVFRDAFTKEILGWNLSRNMDTSLIKTAYQMMKDNHGGELNDPEVYIHSDQGCQYLSTSFKELLESDKFLQSVSARGYSYDNAPVESFFGRLKTAILPNVARCNDFETAKELVDGFLNDYNNKFYQYNLAGLTPHEFYIYQTLEIYPCDNYYGVTADRLRSLDDIVKEHLERDNEERQKRLEKRRERSMKEQMRRKDPIAVVVKDQKILEKVIERYTKHRDYIDGEIRRLQDTLAKAFKAEIYLLSMTEAERKKYQTKESWQKDSILNYIFDMDGLF